MTSRPVRTAAAALLIAAMLSLAAPVPAQAGDFGFADRVSSRVERIVHQGFQLLDSLLQNVGDFVARSTATICGDG